MSDLNSEELIAKRAQQQKIRDFATNVSLKNRTFISQQAKLPSSSEKVDIEICKKKMDSKRMKAIEFARNIPKPKLKLKRMPEAQNGDDYVKDEQDFEEANLLELEAKHNSDKLRIESIRKSMGLN